MVRANGPASGPVPPGLWLQYLVVLAGSDPLVWRRIRIPGAYSFWGLHVAIQDSMGWVDYHLHEFRVVDPESGQVRTFGIPDEDAPEDESVVADWTEFPLDYAEDETPPIHYLYDFGDEWQHAVIFEGMEQGKRAMRRAVCVAGASACPPEDSGGVHGYANLRAAISDPSHPEHEELLEWIGGPIDPHDFSPSKVRFSDPDERWRRAFEGGAT